MSVKKNSKTITFALLLCYFSLTYVPRLVAQQAKPAQDSRFKSMHLEKEFNQPHNRVKKQSPAHSAAQQHKHANASSEGPPPGHAIRVFLKYGLTDKGLAEIELFRDSVEGKRWSLGRICWYTALYYRMDNNHGAARAWSRRARTHGIPELGEGSEEFWLQFGNWDQTPKPSLIRDRIANASRSPFRLTADQLKPVENTKGIVKEIRKEKNTKTPSILDRIRLATWELLLGEYALAHESRLHLPTTSINSIRDGKKHLQEIEASIEASPDLEDEVSKDTELAIRLDTARVRLVAFEQKEKLSREHELERLAQLQQIAREYRELNEEIIRWQTYQTIEDKENTVKSAKSALERLNSIFSVVNQRQDFHLFDGEPAVEGKVTADFKVLETQPLPFAENPISMLKSLQGLAYYNLIREETPVAPEILAQAETWANAALSDDDNGLDVPEGNDPNNLIANLLIGLISDTKGENLAFSKNKEDRQLAAKHFSEAKKSLQVFSDLLTKKQIEDSLLFDITQQRLSNLENVDALTKTARAKANTNQPEVARRSLEKATKRHRDPATALEAIEIGLRAGMSLDELEAEWNQYADLEIVDPKTVDAQIVLAKIRNLRAGQALEQDNADKKRAAAKALVASRKALAKFPEDQQLLGSTRMAAKANIALAFTYGWALGYPNGDESDALPSDIEATHRHAQDAIAFLTNALKEKDITDSANHLRMREAVIAARIAAGHLYQMSLGEHRNESQLEFHAAADEAARLNNAPPVLPLIGSPLLRQVFNNAEGGDVKLAIQEQRRRKMMTLWLEAMYADEFGAASEAATQMQAAEELIFGDDENGSTNLGNLDASELAAAADGFDAKVALPDTCRAFTVLTLINAERYDTALTKAIALGSKQAFNLNGPDEVTQDILTSSIKSINSPLVAFTVAKSIEKYAASLPIADKLARRQMLIQQATNAYRRGLNLLNSERLALRFPHMLSLINRAVDSLSSSDEIYEKTQLANKEQRYHEAIDLALEGLSQHPTDQRLWRSYFISKIELVKSGRMATDNELQSLLDEINQVSQNSFLTEFETSFLAAVILEAMGNTDAAKQKYQESYTHAANTRDRIRSQSNVARLRAALVAQNRIAP